MHEVVLVPRLIGLIAATAIALAVPGCGGSGHPSTTAVRTAAYPATFVARSTDPQAPGIAVAEDDSQGCRVLNQTFDGTQLSSLRDRSRD